MGQGKQAKVLTPNQIKTALSYINQTRNPERDRVIFLLSHKAGLRAAEIANLKWSMITDPENNLIDTMSLINAATKGGKGGRTIPMHKDLKAALVALKELPQKPGGFVIQSERNNRMSAGSITVWFYHLYKGLGFDGCSSHSGRRGFITNVARKVSTVGGSIRDVQQLAGHANLGTTQRYIDGDDQSKRKVIDLI